MSIRNRIPPLLEPYLQLPSEGSQLLLTGVLDATPTWLVTRLLRSALEPSQEASSTTTEKEEEDVSVILVSWLGDYEFWKSEARRGAGLDLARLSQQKRFAFVDGLTNLFSPSENTTSTTNTPPSSSLSPQSQPTRNLPLRTQIPQRGGPIPSRNPVSPQQQAPQQPQPSTTPTPSTHTTLTSPSLQETLKSLTALISSLPPTKKIHLVLDSPTTLLSTSATPSSSLLSSFLLSLRSITHSTTLILESDAPFLDAARPHTDGLPTPLEAELAAFVVQQAHVSRWVVGLRPLDTGKARDVSGVVRASRGGAWDDEGDDGEESVGVKGGTTHKELEALYFVQPDGGVRVFERGEASVG